MLANPTIVRNAGGGTMVSRRNLLALSAAPLPLLAPAPISAGTITAKLASLRQSVPQDRPRLMLRGAETARFREFVDQSRMQGTGPLALRVLAALDDASMPPQRPPIPIGLGAGRTESARQSWRLASEASTRAQLLALRHLLSRQAAHAEIAIRWLSGLCAWSHNSTADYLANAEAFVQSLQPLLFAYDWLHDAMDEATRRFIVDELERRMDTLYGAVRRRITLDADQRPAEGLSHPMRFVATLGHGALALWGERPTAADQLAWVMAWYETRFPIWGGDDGGWTEGLEYHSSALSHHLRFLEDMSALGQPAPLERPFWRRTGYFLTSFLPPYPVSSFADLPTPPRPNASRRMLLDKLARLHGDGELARLAERFGSPSTTGLSYYQFNAIDSVFHAWRIKEKPGPTPATLQGVPRSLHFRDVGWVAMHSHWDDRGDTIMLGFKCSPVGAVSHAFADQNAFVINAYGHAMAVSTGMRDWYGSPHYERWTRAARSKNMVLVDGQGPSGRDPDGTGEILRFVTLPHADFVSGDASPAYRRLARRSLRHVFFVDRRYFVLLDEIDSDRPATHQWLLHSRVPMTIDEGHARIDTDHGDAGLCTEVVLPRPEELEFAQSDRHDPAAQAEATAIPREWHLTVGCRSRARGRRFLTVLRPWKHEPPTAKVSRRLTEAGHAVEIGGDLVLIAEQARGEVSGQQLAFRGAAACIGAQRWAVIDATELHWQNIALSSSRPVSVQVQPQAAAWSLDFAPHEALMLSLAVPRPPIQVGGPDGLQWRMDPSNRGLLLDLSASNTAHQVTVHW